MNTKYILIIILILLIMFFSGYFLIKNNDNLLNNSLENNSLNEDTISNNISLDNTSYNDINNSNDYSSINANSNNHDKYPSNQYNHDSDKKSKDESNEITSEDILKRVKKGVWWDDGNGGDTQDVKLGKPYKIDDDMWLVAAFDKQTGKFLGSVYVGSEGGYSHGPDSYSDYNDIISGKTNQKSNSNHNLGKNSKNVVVCDSSDFHVLAASNPNVSNNPDIQFTCQDDFNPYNDISMDLNRQVQIIESNIGTNTTNWIRIIIKFKAPYL